MSNPVLNAVMQKKFEGVIYDLMLKTNAENVVMSDGKTLAATLAACVSEAQLEEFVNQRIDDIVDGAPDAFDTLFKISEYIGQHEEAYNALVAAIVTGGSGTPSEINASIIVETEERKFVTQEEKDKIAAAGRIICAETAPADLTEKDLLLLVVN